MKITPQMIKALQMIKDRAGQKIYIDQKATVAGITGMINYRTFHALVDHGLIKMSPYSIMVVDIIKKGYPPVKGLTFRGEVILAASKRGKKNVKV